MSVISQEDRAELLNSLSEAVKPLVVPLEKRVEKVEKAIADHSVEARESNERARKVIEDNQRGVLQAIRSQGTIMDNLKQIQQTLKHTTETQAEMGKEIAAQGQQIRGIAKTQHDGQSVMLETIKETAELRGKLERRGTENAPAPAQKGALSLSSISISLLIILCMMIVYGAFQLIGIDTTHINDVIP